ncbi:SAV_2336 N-terminal domain-related protein [Streptomyces sp. NPDC000229]|uniref:SAV_2336 N-terminal domain-related protein n=1 Tax=Streptomyces sp. NPDC000229 TaxID=3154247 RepID=UPI00332D53B3
MSIGRFRSVLTALGLEPTPRELAEILWLADHLPPGTSSAAPSDGTPQRESRSSDKTESGNGNDASPQASSVPVHTPAETTTAGALDRLPARAVRLPTCSSLPQPLHLLRALKPLKRRVSSRRLSELDEEETAEHSAQRFALHGPGTLVPVLRPATERWLDTILVVDNHPTSRMLWTSLTDEVHRLLVQLGAFRDVRIRFLHISPDRPPGLSTRPGPHAGPLQSTSQLCDPSGRRLVLVLTDGVAPGWDQPQVHQAVRQWAAVGPVAVLQALPEHLWPYSAFPTVPARLRRAEHSAANTLLTYTGYRRRTRSLPVGSVPVPVLELASRWLRPWARLVAGQEIGGVDTAVALLRAGSRPAGTPDVRSPQRRLRDFHATATPEAFRLLSCLSAVPLNVFIMRVVQAATLPGTPPSVLAEVMFSGLLVPGEADEETPLEDIPYDFLPGVRAELLAGLRSHEVDAILLEVSRFFERSPVGAPGRVTGLIPDVEGQVRLPTDSIPWARLRAEVLVRAGWPRAVETPGGRPSKPQAPPATSRRPPAGPYRLLEFVTRADFSEVFLGMDDRGNSALVKVQPQIPPSSDPDMIPALMETEAESLRRMGDRYAPRLLGTGTQATSPWLAMECVRSVSGQPAGTLQDRPWAENSPPDDPRAVLLLIQRLAEALERSHSRGIVHGNLSPHAVLVVPDSVVVISWMYSQHDGRLHRYARYRPLRDEFLPPEGYSLTKPLHSSFDIYGLGAIVSNEMTRYQYPQYNQYTVRAGRLSGAGPEIGRLLERCMAVDPMQRPSTAELLEEVRLLRDGPIAYRSTGPVGGTAGALTEVSDAPAGRGAPRAPVTESAEAVIPVYLVADESGSMAEYIGDLNAGLAALHVALLHEPVVASRLRLSILGFSGDVVVRLELADLRAEARLPPLRAGGLTEYAPVFTTLAERIPNDVIRLKSEGYRVYRPIVFFLTDGIPLDDWEEAHSRLINRELNRAAPHIVAFGIGDADSRSLRKVATSDDFAFMAKPQTPAAQAIASYCTALGRSLIASGLSLTDGASQLIILPADDFQPAANTS